MPEDPFEVAPTLLTEGGTLKLEYGGTKEAVPLVLAGPILRRVESDAVTVWVALRDSRNVTLNVYGTTGDTSSIDLTGDRDTMRLGENLHVVAVTASASSPTLQAGAAYEYDLSFSGGDGSEDSLGASGVLKNGIGDVTYSASGTPDLPSFVAPPDDLNDLRIAHGSCRKAHGERWDALPAVDEMIKEGMTDSNERRPNHLVLGGDQMYADDVAGHLLAMLTNHANELLGYEESLPVGDGTSGLSDLKPGHREQIVVGGGELSAADHASSHLMGLGEYYALYLCSWSDVLWPPDGEMDSFPSADSLYPQAVAEVKERAEEMVENMQGGTYVGHGGGDVSIDEIQKANDFQRKVANNSDRVEKFRETLPEVRRALANVPTFMAFDDHDVTDDWFLDGKWVKDALGDDLGHRIVRNGMAAFASFQAWGNTPSEFAQGTDGDTLLQTISSNTNGSHGLDGTDVDERLGVPVVSGDAVAPRQVSTRMDWHFTVDYGEYEIVILDTRTWRGYEELQAAPEVISKEGLDFQLEPKPDGVELSIVLSPVPPWTVPLVDTAQWGKHVKRDVTRSFPWADDEDLTTANEHADYEHWRLQHHALEYLVTALVERGDSDGGTTRSRYVLLGGDVHHGFTTRLQYWGKTPYGPNRTADPSLSDVEYESVFASLTASASKNESGMTRTLHDEGHVFQNTPSRGFYGWNIQGHSLGSLRAALGSILPDVTDHPSHNYVMAEIPDSHFINQEVVQATTVRPDWEYRVDFLRGSKPVTEGEIDGYVPSGQVHGDELEDMLDADEYGVDIVGHNNFGDVTFSWSQDTKEVVHRLWWRLQAGTGSGPLPPKPLTTWTVPMAFDDGNYPQPTSQ